ncbi:MAG TPA: two-component system sensor histidine kinase CreC [Lacunisphaera sp.]
MSLRLRLLLVLLASYCAGGYFITSWTLEQIRPRYLESMEESLVDTSVLLASTAEVQLKDGAPDAESLDRIFVDAHKRKFEAQIYTLKKTALNLRVYLTNATGRVLFDSDGRDAGRDYSQWNDVARTLQGKYGARATYEKKGDPDSLTFYVAAPVRLGDRIVGVLSVGKPTRAINDLVAAAKKKITIGAALGGMALLLVLLGVLSWVIAPLERLTAYAHAVRDGRPARVPALPGQTLKVLGTAFEEMRDALEGRQHIERYTQALTHEVKAPLAAIRGAAELLGEDMPDEQRRKFLANIRNESARIQQIVERLLELSSLEARKTLRQTESIDVAELMKEAAAAMASAYAGARVSLETDAALTATLRGERVLLREALVNLLQNALDFSPLDGVVKLSATIKAGHLIFSVEDDGPGIPDYALTRVFERFYSLPRPGTSRKSTGLGLALVREIAHLHGGDAELRNKPSGNGPGAQATLWVMLG